ncbi:PAS domain S-box protein [Peribacillus glennii]|uniref:histidine kinase n=1 Tax=Peribacillus glennii TaxID=2303991 RepID=A0A372L982_9BACI|nr:PAS domain S-box protein [Peribacillus glennii]RFU62075.1 PAS domain S-box protein [Peribacillus glennii]
MIENKQYLKEFLGNGPHLSLFNNHPDAIYVMDLDGNYIDANSAIKDLTGYEKEEFIHLEPAEIMDKSSFESRAAILRNIGQRSKEDYEITFKHKNGKIWTASVTYIPIIQEHETIGVYGIAKNITEKKETVNKILESEKRFRLLSENSLDMIALHCPEEGKYVYVSPASKRLLGFNPEELLGHSPYEYFHPEDIAFIYEQYDQALNNREEFHLTYRIRRKNGEYIWMETTGRFLLNETGSTITELITVSRDITERKKIEEKYKINEQWYRSLFDYNPAAVFAFDMDGDFISHNENFLKLTGYSKEEIPTMSFVPFVAPKDLAKTAKHFELAKKGTPQHYETTLVDKSGEHRPVQVSNLPIIVEGDIVGVYGIAFDISDRVRAQNQLKESEQRYRSLFDYNPSAVYSFDLHGNYKSVNRMLEAMTGYTQDELLQMNYSELLHPDDLEYTDWFFEQATLGKTQNYDVTLLRKNGEAIEVNVANVPIMVDNKIVGVYGICMDITDRKRYMAQVERLSNQNRLILDSAAEGILGLNLEGKILFLNKAGGRILGYQPDQISAGNLDFLVHRKRDIEQFNPETCKIIQTGLDGVSRFVDMDIFYQADGTEIPVQYSVSPLYDQGIITGTVVTFSDITEKLKLEQMKEEHAQIELEFSIASRVQKTLLTQVQKLALPESTDLGVVSVPIRKLNGDFYNVVTNGQQIRFGIADISGKGMAAAILMSMIKYAMDQIDDQSLPHEILHELNQYCANYLDPSMFVTMFMGTFDIKTGVFRYASAGHEPGILYQAERGRMIDINAKGAVLGLSKYTVYKTEEIDLEPDDMILLYTDGVTEERQNNEIDNNEKLKELFALTDKHLPAQDIVDALYQDIKKKQKDQIFDDQTILLFKNG